MSIASPLQSTFGDVHWSPDHSGYHLSNKAGCQIYRDLLNPGYGFRILILDYPSREAQFCRYELLSLRSLREQDAYRHKL